MQRLFILLFFFTSFVGSAFAQKVALEVVTARGKSLVYADTVTKANIKATVANSNGYFRVDFAAEGFDGAFNIPVDYQGSIGVEERIKPAFLRKDAHFTGVVTIKREDGDLILLTRASDDVPELKSQITKGIWGNTTASQKFVCDLEYQTYTYDNVKFIKRDFIVRLHIEMPVEVNWTSVQRAWKPEGLPAPLKTAAPAPTATEAAPDTVKAPADTTAAAIEAAPADTTLPAADQEENSDEEGSEEED